MPILRTVHSQDVRKADHFFAILCNKWHLTRTSSARILEREKKSERRAAFSFSPSSVSLISLGSLSTLVPFCRLCHISLLTVSLTFLSCLSGIFLSSYPCPGQLHVSTMLDVSLSASLSLRFFVTRFLHRSVALSLPPANIPLHSSPFLFFPSPPCLSYAVLLWETTVVIVAEQQENIGDTRMHLK